MGTNYYISKLNPPTEDLFTKTRNLHIGKSSVGWCFALNVTEIPTLDEWIKLFNDCTLVITNEYGTIINPKEMIKIITERKNDGQPLSDEFFKSNHCEKGPNNLARSVIGRGHCVGHGPKNSTYDMIVGEFS